MILVCIKKMQSRHFKIKMSIGNHTHNFIDFLRLPRPQGERRKSISPPGVGVNKLIFKRSVC
jgi:hypothetical protein